MKSVDALYKFATSPHFQDADIITVKPGGSEWDAAEFFDGTDLVTLDVTEEIYDGLFHDVKNYRVDDSANPTQIILK